MNDLIKRPDHQKVIRRSEKFLKQIGYRPNTPIDVEKAAKLLGVTVLRNDLEGDVSGYLFISKGSAPIIGVNAQHPEPRQRFTIAHELGHLLLHASADKNASFVDKSFVIINRDSVSSQGIETNEIEANLFAAEILMPAECLYKDLVKYPNPADLEALYRDLAEKYKVSNEAMKFRLNNLGFIRL